MSPTQQRRVHERQRDDVAEPQRAVGAERTIAERGEHGSDEGTGSGSRSRATTSSSATNARSRRLLVSRRPVGCCSKIVGRDASLPESFHPRTADGQRFGQLQLQLGAFRPRRTSLPRVESTYAVPAPPPTPAPTSAPLLAADEATDERAARGGRRQSSARPSLSSRPRSGRLRSCARHNARRRRAAPTSNRSASRARPLTLPRLRRVGHYAAERGCPRQAPSAPWMTTARARCA